MRKLFTAAIVLAGVVAAAGTASAQSSTYCDSYARAEMERLYPTGGGAIRGGLLGAVGGGLIAGATGGNVGTGVGIGAGAGLVVGSAAWQARRQTVFNEAFSRCMGGGGPPPTPVYAPPPPPPPPLQQPPYWARITGSGLNVRNAPGTTGTTVIFVLQPYQIFQIVSCDPPASPAAWCWIDLSGVNGWVARNHTTPAS